MERAECVTSELYAGSAFLPNVAARPRFALLRCSNPSATPKCKIYIKEKCLKSPALIYLANFSTSLTSLSSNYTSLFGKGASGYTIANGSQEEARLQWPLCHGFNSWSWPYGCKYSISTCIDHRKNASADSASCCRL